MNKKYIFITGGVVSSLGKGLTSASIGMLLESRGLTIALLKLDPYLNVDPGTMNPFEHGEVYVTEDGTEADLDLGHYYRFTNSPLSKASNTTSGKIYDAVIKKERLGEYLGKTVQVIPHVTDAIKKHIFFCAHQNENIDVTLIEIGGTVGDIESQPFLEAIRQLRMENPSDCINIHLTYVPFIRAAGEVKTKPTQHSVQQLRSIGIFPDFLLCRSEKSLPLEQKKKISLFCSVAESRVLEQIDVKNTIYELPINLMNQKLDSQLCSLLQLPKKKADLTDWKKMIHRSLHPKCTLRIALVGKYTKHQDAYKSVVEALTHAAIFHEIAVSIEGLESDNLKEIEGFDGYLIPGGFGERGFEGKVQIATHCRRHKIPYFGICLGMQVMVVEFAREVLGLKEAHSTEMNPKTKEPVISLLKEQKGLKDLGATMRLGAYPCNIRPNTKAFLAYQKNRVSERHRHRYEVNNTYLNAYRKKGLSLSGMYEKEGLVEIVEVEKHPWMVGVQFHPEFQSKPTQPHPLFKAFIQAILSRG